MADMNPKKHPKHPRPERAGVLLTFSAMKNKLHFDYMHCII